MHGHKLGYTWLILEILSRVVLIGCYFLVRLIHPRVKYVWASEAYQYGYPHKEDMISTKMMAVYMVISLVFLPPPLIALWQLKRWTVRQMADDLLIFILGLSGGVLLTLNWVELGKRTFSRYRPDFLSRCTGITSEYELGQLVESMSGLSQFPCPVGTDYSSKDLTDGRMSWPSGHSATSTCVYVYLSCWFYLRLYPYNRLGFWKFATPLAIALFPFFVAITRVLDYRHHYTDVISGGILGFIMGLLSFRFYYKLSFPPVFEPEIPVSLKDTSGQQDAMLAAEHDYEHTSVPISTRANSGPTSPKMR